MSAVFALKPWENPSSPVLGAYGAQQARVDEEVGESQRSMEGTTGNAGKFRS